MAGDMLKEIPRPKMWNCFGWPVVAAVGAFEIILVFGYVAISARRGSLCTRQFDFDE
jgi:hypothetical protein